MVPDKVPPSVAVPVFRLRVTPVAGLTLAGFPFASCDCYNGEGRPGGGIATSVDGCDRQFRRRTRSDVECLAGRRRQAGARRLERVTSASLVDREIIEGRSAIYCAYRRGSAQRAAGRIGTDGHGNRGAAVRYQPAARVKDLYCYCRGNRSTRRRIRWPLRKGQFVRRAEHNQLCRWAVGCATLAPRSGRSIYSKIGGIWSCRSGRGNLECSRLRGVIVCSLKYYRIKRSAIPSHRSTSGKRSRLVVDAQSRVTSRVVAGKGYGH